MNITFWGTRGSVAAPGPETAHYGGNTSCVEVRSDDGKTILVLDAGTGIRRLGSTLTSTVGRIDLFLTHLHMDHIQGLGFFAPFYMPQREIHLWGPASTRHSLHSRLSRYMSPPLFPVRLRDLPCHLTLHEIPDQIASVGPFTVRSRLVCHPGSTVGLRITSGDTTLAYLPDHEPALGVKGSLGPADWTSGHDLAAGADLLIHDAQYDDEQYDTRVGWGHSTVGRAIEFATLVGAHRLVLFHNDPARDDAELSKLVAATVARSKPRFTVTAAAEGMIVHLPEGQPAAA